MLAATLKFTEAPAHTVLLTVGWVVMVGLGITVANTGVRDADTHPVVV